MSIFLAKKMVISAILQGIQIFVRTLKINHLYIYFDKNKIFISRKESLYILRYLKTFDFYNTH